MIQNFNSQNRKEDLKILLIVLAVFGFVVWLCTPPGNKFIQMCFWGNHVKYAYAKMFNNDASTEYIFHRNNAIYIAQMYKDKQKKTAISEMDKAILTLPDFVSEKELQSMYRDRAYIKLYTGDHKGALDDFLHSGKIEFNDYLKMAMLFKVNGNLKYAISYCNAILDVDFKAYAGYACLADIYTTARRPEIGIRVWDLSIDRSKNNPRAYVERAKLKQMVGDTNGYEQDIKTAKELLPTVDLNYSITDEALHPKVLRLPIR